MRTLSVILALITVGSGSLLSEQAMAMVAPPISKTMMVDPEDGTPVDMVPRAEGERGLMSGCEAVGNAAQTFSSANRFRGNRFRFDAPGELIEFAMELNFSVVANLYFYVYVYQAETDDYQQVVEILLPSVAGRGLDFYWSGPIFIDEIPLTLAAGNDYVLGVAWGPHLVSYGRSVQPHPFPFSHGDIVGSSSRTLPAGPPMDPITDIVDFAGGAYAMDVCYTPEPGACCSATLFPGPIVCEERLQANCPSPVGFFQGERVTCEQAQCTFGACCTPCGVCEEAVTEEICSLDFDGVWSADTLCADVTCEPVVGACCGGGVCTEVCEEDCNAMGGVYRGDGTDCDPNFCVGACCLAEFGCIELPADTCTEFGGSPRAEGTNCATLSPEDECGGACCVGNDTLDSCSVISQRGTCTTALFPLAVYLGDQTDCPEVCGNVSSFGKCCLQDGLCLTTTEDFCGETWINGQWNGTGTTCDSDGERCPTGACCLDGACEEMTQDACERVHLGEYGGPGSTCGPETCAAMGACCQPNEDCAVMFPSACELSGGVYQGDNTSCAPDTCIIDGACCLDEDGSCADVRSLAACNSLGGTHHAGVECLSDPCPSAACCVGNEACEMRSHDSCDQAGGVFQGTQATCDPNPCLLPPAGACCVGVGCQVGTPDACTGLGGDYLGDDSTCDGDPCQAISIISSAPPDGAIDARQPLVPGGADPTGWSSIVLTFDGPTALLTVGDFLVASEGGVPPSIMSLVSDGNTLTIDLDTFIPPAAWTSIVHIGSGTLVRLGYLPADVNADGTSTPTDILDLIDTLNGVTAREEWQTDINRSSLTEPSDILTLIDLLNGAGDFDPWNGVSLP